MSGTVKTLIKYGICALVGALLLLFVLVTENYFEATDQLERIKIWCDAFTFPGVMLMLSAALVYLSNHGAFWGIGYGLGRFLKRLVPFSKFKDETYGDYVERKTANGSTTGFGFIFFTGLAYLLVSIVFLVIYYKIQG